MERKTSSGESDPPPGSFSASKISPCPQDKAETSRTPNLDLVGNGEVETVSVKLEKIVDGDEISINKGASQTSIVETDKLPTAQPSINGVELPRVTWSRADSDTSPCPLYDDPTSYQQGVPSVHPGDPLKEERLFTYEEPTEVEESDPLADPVLGSSPESNRSFILYDVKPSLDRLVSSGPEISDTIKSMGEYSLDELKMLDIRRLNSASSTNPRSAKPPVHNPLESIKSLIREKLLNSSRENPFQEPTMPSNHYHSDTKVFDNLPSTTNKNTSVKSVAQRNEVSTTQSKACQAALNTPEKEFLTKLFAPSSDSQTPSLFFDKHQLDQRAKLIVYHVANYFQEKKKKFTLKYNVAAVASDATNLPKYTVQSIISMGRRSLQDDETLKFPRFGRYHTEKCKNCGDVLVDFAIREILFNGYVEEWKALTIKEISAYLDADELSVCQDFLRRRIRELGIDLMRSIATSRYIPLERPELTASRYRYFQDIQKYRIMQRQIVYIFEADLSKVFHGKVTWEPLEGHPTKDDTHLMTVIHAAKESGFIDGSLFVHSDFSRQHRRRKWPLTLFWLNLYLPKLPRGSVVVLGHSRHNFLRPAKPKPDASWPKQDIVKWLHDHQEESFSNALPSAVLLEKVNTIDVGTKFGIDDLIISHGHIPLHLPQNHRELNPVELVWRKILEKFSSLDISSEGHMRHFLQNEFDSVPPSELQEAFELAKKHENILRQLDMRIDAPVAEVIRRVGGILDRNYALEEDEISDDDSSTGHVLDESKSLERFAVKSSEPSKTKSKDDELDRPRKKKKTTNWTQAGIETNDQTAQLMSQNSPSSWNHSQEITTREGWDDSQFRNLGGRLRTYDGRWLVQPKKERTSSTESADSSVGLEDQSSQPILQSSSTSWNQCAEIPTVDTDANSHLKTFRRNLSVCDESPMAQHVDNRMSSTNRASNVGARRRAQTTPQNGIRSWNVSQRTDECSNTELKTSDEKLVEQPELRVSSSWSLFAHVQSDSDAISTGSETIEITSVNLSDAGPSSFRSSSVSNSKSVADVRDITLTNPIEEQGSEESFWGTTHQGLTSWPKSLTDSVTLLIPPLPNPEELEVENSPSGVINLDDSDEEKPGLIDFTGKKENIPYLKNMDVKDTETPVTRKSPSPNDPLGSDLFRELKTLISRPRIVLDNADVLKEHVRLYYQQLKKS